MPDNTELGVLICSAACVAILGLPIPITSVAIAAANTDDPCQSVDSIGLNLSQWLLGAGIVGLLLFISLLTLIIVMACHPGAAGVSIIVLLVLNSIFQIIYTTLGAVVLFRSNKDCLDDGTDLGIMSLIVLIFYWISILTSCCSSKSKKSD